MWSPCTYRKYLCCEGREVCLVQSWSMHSVVVWGFGSVVAVGHQNVRQEMGIGKSPSGRLNALKYTEDRREWKGQGLTWFLLSIRESWIKFELRTCWTVERVCHLVWCSVGNRTWYSCCSRCWCEEGELEVASCRMCCVQLHSFSSCPRRGSDSKFVSLSNAEWQVVWRVTVTSQNYFLRLYPFSSPRHHWKGWNTYGERNRPSAWRRLWVLPHFLLLQKRVWGHCGRWSHSTIFLRRAALLESAHKD